MVGETFLSALEEFPYGLCEEPETLWIQGWEE